MTEEQFLNSTLRQLLILEELNSDYLKNNLREVLGECIGSLFGDNTQDEEEKIYVESLSDLF
ncbi:MAG: hypothetical protein ACLR60_18110 [Clostridium paraputrificum]